MAKGHSKFVCQQCGYESAQFMGKCPNCGEWNSLVETIVSNSPHSALTSRRGFVGGTQSSKPVKLTEIRIEEMRRTTIGMHEIDQVLGGGLVPGQVVLLAGEPGIGKSTLLLQIAASMKASVLYASGEESVEQISIRASRLGLGKNAGIQLLAETNVEKIIEVIEQLSNKVIKEDKTGGQNNYPITHLLNYFLIVDSIQTLWTEELTGTPGSVGQVRECARRLLLVAKERKIPLIIVGHVTKEGALAGPKVLEHLVDTVLYLEGEQYGQMRILRSTKNRFGPTDEVGIFRMIDDGLQEVDNPSEAFFTKRRKDLPGLATVAVLEGTRPLLVEVQALVSPSELKSPRRVGNGVNFNRLLMLVAILSKHLRLPLANFDVFVNVSGGLTLDDPGADLGIAMAIYTSFKNVALARNSVCIGELSLLGEIRSTQQEGKRTKEAKRLGLTSVYSSETFSFLTQMVKEL